MDEVVNKKSKYESIVKDYWYCFSIGGQYITTENIIVPINPEDYEGGFKDKKYYRDIEEYVSWFKWWHLPTVEERSSVLDRIWRNINIIDHCSRAWTKNPFHIGGVPKDYYDEVGNLLRLKPTNYISTISDERETIWKVYSTALCYSELEKIWHLAILRADISVRYQTSEIAITDNVTAEEGLTVKLFSNSRDELPPIPVLNMDKQFFFV